jgi:hypothetical protein
MLFINNMRTSLVTLKLMLHFGCIPAQEKRTCIVHSHALGGTFAGRIVILGDLYEK